jgi:VCBS repeat-containing protein
VNDAPVAVDDSYSVNEDATLTVGAPGVLGNDTDVEGDSLTALLVSEPAHGTLAFNANGSFKYVPSPNYNGLDSFTYKASDGSLDSGVATVTITVSPVNDAPVVVDDSYNVNEDTSLTVEAPGVLGNDTDVDGDALAAVLVSGPAHGTLTLSTNGSFVYLPATHYTGIDTFTYQAGDGQAQSDPATVTITVMPVSIALNISDAGADATIECPNAPVFTPPTATGGCDPNPRVVEVSDVTTPGACAGSYTRTKTWKAVDACGNESPTRSQTITVVDTTAPVLTCPPDQTVEEYTSTDPDITGWATAVDDCSPAPAISYTDVTNGVSTITTIARTWTATDCAGNRSQCLQTITVLDRSNEGTLITDGLGCTLPNNQFRLIFTPDLRNTPCYKLNASNPGQFFYNLFYAGTPGSIETFKVTLPYPFVTQGARPIQVYDGVTVHSSGSQTCLVHGNNISAGSQQVTLSDYSANQVMGVSTYTMDVTLTVPATGFLCLTVHLDYGLKISSGYSRDATGDATACADTGDVLVPNNESYTFSVGGAATDSATVSSYNTFKRRLGVRGSGQCRVATFSEPCATVSLENANGTLLGTGMSDQDGWCVLNCKSTIKASTFYVTLTPPGRFGSAQTRVITLKPTEEDVEVDFTTPQVSGGGQHGDGRRGDGRHGDGRRGDGDE